MPQFAERPKLLRPVARNASADRKDAKSSLSQQRGREMLQILERIKPQLVSSGRFAQTIVQRDIRDPAPNP